MKDPSRAVGQHVTAEATWTSDHCITYALGVGAGAGDPDDPRELPFTTENSSGTRHAALPTFPVTLPLGVFDLLDHLGEFDRAMLVHASQSLRIHQPIETSGSVRGASRILSVLDKGSGALVEMETEAWDRSTHDLLWTARTAGFIRGAGGWGGNRGAHTPPQPVDRPPDHRITYATRSEQALIYRLSGDRNPLHSDPLFARRAGFAAPILHGLCTYGFAARALLHTLCASDPRRFTSISARFRQPTFPGDVLTTAIYVLEPGCAAFDVRRNEEEVVLDRGSFTYEEDL